MSEWYRDALREEWGISEDRLVLLPFYVDTDKWKPLDPKPVKARSQVVFIGGEIHRKGGHIVYELARLEKFKNVDFHVVSPNAEEGPENLRVHRFLRPDSDELIRLTAECDIFVLPTRADASPNAPLEAAACGIPAIITRRGGIPEIVIDGLTGSVLREQTLDSFAEELSIYLSNPELVAQRGRNARQHVERNYSKTRHFTILRNVINRAAAEVNGYVLPRLLTLPERNSTGDVGGRRV
jgi:glycosyltransferase involved in cell wall biosynthesis